MPALPHLRRHRAPLGGTRLGAVALVAAALAGCGGGGDGGSEPTPTPRAGSPAAGRPPSAADRVALATVAVRARVGGDRVTGSGVVVDAGRGLVLTSARTVWGATSLKLDTPVGVLLGRLVARAPCDDLAVVQAQPVVPGLVARPLRTRCPRARCARSRGAGPRATARRRPSRSRWSARPARSCASTGGSARTAPGGPLVDAGGRLVGLVQAGAPEPAALTGRVVRQRLDELQPGRSTVYVGWREHYRCAPRLHRLTQAAHPRFQPSDARLNPLCGRPASPAPATRRAHDPFRAASVHDSGADDARRVVAVTTRRR